MAVDKTKNEPRIDADEVLGGIVEWVSIESPSHDAKSVNRVVDHVEGQFRDLGLKLDRTPGVDGFGDILECKTPWGEGKGILVLAHLDTVHPIGMIEKELKVRREGDSIFGPGIYDMKAGGYMAYYALRHLIRQGKKTKLPVTFLFIPEEEVGSPTSRARIEEAARGHKYALVMEPGRDGDKVVTSRKGVGRFTLTVKGKAAHAGVRHQDGRSAILALAEFLLEAAKIPTEMPGVMVNIGNIRGGAAATNVVPHFAESEIDIRITQTAYGPPLLARFQALADRINARDGLKLTLKGGFNRPPKKCLPAEEAVFPEWQRAARDVGVPEFTWVHGGGGSDGNFLTAGGLPNLDGIGPIGDNLHSDREFCRVETIAPRAQIVALFLHRVAVGEITLGAPEL